MQPLSPALFAVIGGFLRDRLGLDYGPDRRVLLQDRLTARAREAGFRSLFDYYYHLRYDAHADDEIGALADVLVVSETYFFREYDQLLAIVDHVLAPAIARGVRPRVWSAACATGEEPLSLAMVLDARGLLDQVTLIASDLSARSLSRAREGRWTPRALRVTNAPALVERYLEVVDGHIEVDAKIRAAVAWQQVNLVDGDQVGALGRFDVILCRNVLIYFDDATVRNVIVALGASLRPQGHLFVGVAESLLRHGTSLVCEERGGAFCYRRGGR